MAQRSVEEKLLGELKLQFMRVFKFAAHAERLHIREFHQTTSNCSLSGVVNEKPQSDEMCTPGFT